MRPHDLLWLSPQSGIALPDWGKAEWPVVVRRADPAGRPLLPVGLRGPMRHQRQAAWVAPTAVERHCAPEALAHGRPWESAAQRDIACLEALALLAPMLDEIALPWGPTGSVGFALASGVALLRPDSDLDLLLRADKSPHPDQIEGLMALKACARCRLDIQIDTGRGGFALDEWLAGRRTVLLKTAKGPRLVADPWHPAAEEAH